MTSTTETISVVRRFAMTLLLSGILTGCASFDRLSGNGRNHCPHCCGESANKGRVLLHDQDNVMLGSSMSEIQTQLPLRDTHYPGKTTGSSDDAFAPGKNNLPLPIDETDQTTVSDATRKSYDEAKELLKRIALLEQKLDQERTDREVVDRKVDALNKSVSQVNQENSDLKSDMRNIERTSELQHESEMATLKGISQMVDQLSGKNGSPGKSISPQFTQ